MLTRQSDTRQARTSREIDGHTAKICLKMQSFSFQSCAKVATAIRNVRKVNHILADFEVLMANSGVLVPHIPADLNAPERSNLDRIMSGVCMGASQLRSATVEPPRSSLMRLAPNSIPLTRVRQVMGSRYRVLSENARAGGTFDGAIRAH